MIMGFNAAAARAAVNDRVRIRNGAALAAAEAKVSATEKFIEAEAKMGNCSHTIRVEIPAIFGLVRQILEKNGYRTSSMDGKTITIEW